MVYQSRRLRVYTDSIMAVVRKRASYKWVKHTTYQAGIFPVAIPGQPTNIL